MSDLYSNIPAELRERKQWVVCVKGEKIPRVPISGYPKASSTDPSTWRPFNQCARAALDDSRLVLGYVLAADDPFACIDFDVKEDTTPEQLEGFVRLVRDLNSYTETSIGGQGVHVWVRGKIGAGRRHSGVEIYSQERFIICTGNAIAGYPKTVEDGQAALNWMISRIDGVSGAPTGNTVELVEIPPTRTDAEVWEALRNHEKASRIIDLCNGKWRELGYESASEADLALIAYIANSTQSNEQVRRLFRQTVLATVGRKRDKHTRGDYHIDFNLKTIRGQQQHRHSVFSATPQARALAQLTEQHERKRNQQRQEREYLDSLRRKPE